MGDSPKSRDNSRSFLMDYLKSHILNKVEGSDEMLKEMKADFSSFNTKVNSDSIKKLEYQMSQLSAQLESKPQEKYADDMMINSKVNHDKCLAVLTRSGKSISGNVKVNGEATTSKEGDEAVGLDKSDQAPKNDKPKGVEESPKQLTTEDLQTSYDGDTSSSKPIKLFPKVSPPFPQRLKKRDEDAKFQNFLFVFKTLSINLPLVEVLLEILGYSKFMKELVTKKRSMDFETVEVSHSYSAIMPSNVIIKKVDPGAFTIPCTIRILQFSKALCDLGTSINLMSYAIFKQLRLGEPKSTAMRLLMADRSIKYLIGILYDILVRVYRFIFPADYVILDCEIDGEVPIILGRPFSSSGRALVDVESGESKFLVNDEDFTFNVCKSIKQPSDINVVSTLDVIDEAVTSVSEVFRVGKPLTIVLPNYDEDEV
ncbi:uncharacterized protein LOC125821608 [Solanum verrucosum]|uniref:uncharacterized protein LOC125821608 n=1 Tax=Solanum verrucosum TaxID=315347 RepID=UPI0020D1385B|nr:uncharacterized protein LOC125821608 [Solanum verrucosum]